jgi:hypothetical protein
MGTTGRMYEEPRLHDHLLSSGLPFMPHRYMPVQLLIALYNIFKEVRYSRSVSLCKLSLNGQTSAQLHSRTVDCNLF